MRLDQKTIRPLLFLLVFLLFFGWLWPQSLIAQSGDAADIWQAITSYYSDAPKISYVMYKGVVSIFPYVWLYELARKIGLDDFLLIKAFYSSMFAYISVLGMPFVWSKITKKPVGIFFVFLFSVVLFLMWNFNYALNNLIIDLPNLTTLIIALSLVIKVKETKLNNFFYSLGLGLFLGLLLCGAGQYQLSFYSLLLFLILSLFKKIKKISVVKLLSIAMILVSMGTILYIDSQFLKQTEITADKNQDWFLTKKEWLDLSLSGRNMLWLKYGSGPTVENVRLRMIGSSINENFISQVGQGGYAYPASYYVKLIFTYPLDFIAQAVNKLFLAISLDNGNRNIFHLWIIYTLLYLALSSIFQKVKKVKDLFNQNTLLIISFILPSLTPLLFHVEMRYFLSLQILIIGSVLLKTSGFIKLELLKKQVFYIINRFKSLRINNLDFKINYNFLLYITYLVICFAWYAAIYENAGITGEILFRTSF